MRQGGMATETGKKHRQGAVMHRSLSGAIERVRTEGDADDVYRYEFKASSDAPVEMWRNHFEILDHGADSVRLGWLNSGNAPMLGMHNRSKQVGVIQSARLEADHIVVSVRVSRSQTDLIHDIEDGIVRNVSIGYRVHAEQLEERDTDEHGYTTRAVWRTTDWEPNEVSFVSIPADKSVGLGRSEEDAKQVKARVMELEQRISEDEGAHSDQQKRSTKKNSMADTVTIEKEQADKQRKDAVTAERTRSQGIATVAEKAREAGHGDFAAVAAEFIREGKTVEDMQRHVLENISKTPGVTTSELGLSENEQKRYSIENVVQGVINGDLHKRAAFELEVSAAHQQAVGRSGQRIAIPVDMLLRGYTPKDQRLRDMISVTNNGVGQTNTAANIVETSLLPELFVESLREHSNILGMVTMIPGLTGDVEIPIELLNPGFTWVGEDTAPDEESYGLGKFKLEFKSVGTKIPFTRKAGKQTTPQIENLLMNSIRKGLAIELAKVILTGDGTNQPLGIFNAPGIGAVTTAGTLTRTKFRELRKALGDANVDLSRARGLCSSNGEFQITDTLLDAGSGKFLGEITEGNRLRTIIGGFDTTNVCPAANLLFGDFSMYFMGMWGGVEIDRDTATGADTGSTYLRFWQDVDGIPARGADFAAVTDLSV